MRHMNNEAGSKNGGKQTIPSCYRELHAIALLKVVIGGIIVHLNAGRTSDQAEQSITYLPPMSSRIRERFPPI